MRTHLLVCAAVAAIIAGSGVASAQSKPDTDYKPPRTTWGAPALDGVWTNASLTSLQKSAAASAVTVTEEERQRLLSKNRYTLVREDEAGVSTVPIPISRTGLARLVSARPETVIRALAALLKDGTLRTVPDGFAIPELERLRSVAREG